MPTTVTYIISVITVLLIVSSIFITLDSRRREKAPAPASPDTEPEPVAEVTNIIPPDRDELFEGPVTLKVESGARTGLISYLTLALAEDPAIHVISKDGMPDKSSLIRLLIKKPLPLFKVLYHIPVVQEVYRVGQEVHVVTI